MRTGIESSRIVIGVDEAGYGPNIGPLVVAATAWRVPQKSTEATISERVGLNFSTKPWKPGCTHIPLGDSKKLYQSGSGLQTLEIGLLAVLSQIARRFVYKPRDLNLQEASAKDCDQKNSHQNDSAELQAPSLQCFRELLSSLVYTLDESRWNPNDCEWYKALPTALPAHGSVEEVQRLADLAGSYLKDCEMELAAVRVCVVTESSFNRMVNELGSKGVLLSKITLRLVNHLLAEFAEEQVEVFCDRQGGRKHYSSVLLDAMPDEWFQILSEQNDRSSYQRVREPELKVHFTVGGDSFPPTALASMTAKYFRERLMGCINSYWSSHVANLKPTAGYPQDAKRFRMDIAAAAERLGHSIEDWWRTC